MHVQATHAGSPVAGRRLQRAWGGLGAGARGCGRSSGDWVRWAQVRWVGVLEQWLRHGSKVGHGSCGRLTATTKSKACATTPLAAVDSGRTRFITSGALSLLVVFLSCLFLPSPLVHPARAHILPLRPRCCCCCGRSAQCTPRTEPTAPH